MNTKLAVAFFVLALLPILAIFFWMLKTEKRLKKFFMGKKAKDLEDTILALENDIEELKKSKEKFEGNFASMDAKLKKSIRGLEVARFNPFPDQGSNQSFAISLLNEEGNGVVLSSLYSRERMSVFAKPIKNGKSEYELTVEEKEVLKKSEVK